MKKKALIELAKIVFGEYIENIIKYDGPVAQRIEQLPSKQLVVGSIPARATIFMLKFQQNAPSAPHNV